MSDIEERVQRVRQAIANARARRKRSTCGDVDLDQMTADELRNLATERYERARTEAERSQVAEDNEMLIRLANIRERFQ